MECRIDISSGSDNKPERGDVVISKEGFENLKDIYVEQFTDVFRNICSEFFVRELFRGC